MSTAFMSTVPACLAQGADLGAVLDAPSSLSGSDHAVLLDAWLDLSALHVRMIVDEDMGAQDVADAVCLPVEAVRAFDLALTSLKGAQQ